MAGISENHFREYETLYVLKPEIEDEKSKEHIIKMKELVEREGGKHLQATNWGRKKLAWERDRNLKGMYVHHRYLGKPGLVKEYERTLAIDEDCILRQTKLLNKRAMLDSAQVGEDVLAPPAPKEVRRDEERSERPRRNSSRDEEE